MLKRIKTRPEPCTHKGTLIYTGMTDTHYVYFCTRCKTPVKVLRRVPGMPEKTVDKNSLAR